MQAAVLHVGTGCGPSPLAGSVRRETYPPGVATIPESINLVRLAAGRKEDDRQRRILERVLVFRGAFKGLLEAAPFRHDRVSREKSGGKTGDPKDPKNVAMFRVHRVEKLAG